MALGRAEVDQPALGDEVELLAAEVELLDVLADVADVALGQRAQRGEVELGVEMAGVGHDRAVAHRLEVLAPEDVDVAGRGDEQLAPGGRLAGGHHREAVHQRLERADRVDLDDRDVRAVAGHPGGDPLADPAVAGDDDLAPGDQDVGRAQDAVERALAGPVAVVEEVLGLGLVDRDDREPERPSAAIARRRMTPVVVSSVPAWISATWSGRSVWSRFTRSQPSSIVSCGCVSATDAKVRVVGVVVLAAPGERGDAVLGDERGRDVVLGRQRVARREHDLARRRP